MTRSNAREIACHLVFEMNFNDITAGEALRTLMEEDYYPTLKGIPDKRGAGRAGEAGRA